MIILADDECQIFGNSAKHLILQMYRIIDFSQYGDADIFVPPNEDDTGVVGDRPSLSNLSAQFLLHLS